MSNQKKLPKLLLTVSSVVEEFQATKARPISTILLSIDGNVRHTGKTTKCCRKWKPQQVVTEVDPHWKHPDHLYGVPGTTEPWILQQEAEFFI